LNEIIDGWVALKLNIIAFNSLDNLLIDKEKMLKSLIKNRAAAFQTGWGNRF
jgi:hypothetical protein